MNVSMLLIDQKRRIFLTLENNKSYGLMPFVQIGMTTAAVIYLLHSLSKIFRAMWL